MRQVDWKEWARKLAENRRMSQLWGGKMSELWKTIGRPSFTDLEKTPSPAKDEK